MMIDIIAAATPDANFLKGFLEVVTYIVVLGVALKTLLSRKPGYAELATKAELEKKADQKDLERIETEVKKIDADLVSTERRIVSEIKDQGRLISSELKGFATEARDGRVAIWDELNKTKDKLNDKK